MSKFENGHRISVKIELLDSSQGPSKYAFGPIDHILDLNSFKSGIENPLGSLGIVSDEVLINGVSYFCIEKTGLLKGRSIPILFGDEKLERLSTVSSEGYTNMPFYFTGRRFLIASKSFIQSKWIKPSFNSLFLLLGADHWLEGLRKTAYDAISMNVRLFSSLEGKGIEIGSLKHIHGNDWEPRIHSPRRYYLFGVKREKPENFFEIAFKKAQEAAETDILDLIALENFCLTTDLDVHKISIGEVGSVKLKQGRLNLKKKKSGL